MGIFFVFLGILAGLALYLYFINKFHETEDRRKSEPIQEENDDEEEVPPTKEDGLKSRYCPLCHSLLEKHDSVYAEMYKGEERPKV